MKASLLMLLLAAVAAAGEKPPDPVKTLPKCLQPGVSVVYDRAGSGSRLPGTVTFRTLAGSEPGTVKIERGYDSGDRGILTERDLLSAVLDAKTKTILTFTYSVGRKTDEPLVVASRLVRELDKDKKPVTIHERLTYAKKSEKPRVKRTRLAIEGAWAPDLLEPFLVPLLGVAVDAKKEVSILTVLTGTVGRAPSVYASFGSGKMKLGDADEKCVILHRTRGDDKGMLYLRAADSLPLKSASAFLTLRTAKEKK